MMTDRKCEASAYAHTKTRTMERHGLERSLLGYQTRCDGARPITILKPDT